MNFKRAVPKTPQLRPVLAIGCRRCFERHSALGTSMHVSRILYRVGGVIDVPVLDCMCGCHTGMMSR